MACLTISRRMFLKSSAAVGMALTLANSPWPPASIANAQGTTTLIAIPKGLESLRLPAAQNYLAAGKGSLWVSGNFLNTFRNNLNFENLPTNLRAK